jgi:Activator of Hsp90 ATPase homolog 1-like protein
MTTGNTFETIQIFRVYIKATPEAIWEAITEPEWTVRYGFAPLVEYELRSGGAFRAHANEGMKALGCPDIKVQRGLVGLATAHLEPSALPRVFGGGPNGGPHSLGVGESTTVAVIVILAWVVGWTALGAWRMAKRDA